jgi:hypothetical protein
MQYPVPHHGSAVEFQQWLVVPSFSLDAAVSERQKMFTMAKLNPQHIARQLTTRNHARLNYTSPAGQSMDSVTGTRVPELDCLVV